MSWSLLKRDFDGSDDCEIALQSSPLQRDTLVPFKETPCFFFQKRHCSSETIAQKPGPNFIELLKHKK